MVCLRHCVVARDFRKPIGAKNKEPMRSNSIAFDTDNHHRLLPYSDNPKTFPVSSTPFSALFEARILRSETPRDYKSIFSFSGDGGDPLETLFFFLHLQALFFISLYSQGGGSRGLGNLFRFWFFCVMRERWERYPGW